LDSEKQQMYNLKVRVSDSHIPSLSSTASITVYIRDLNDNAPAFKFPNPANDSVHISNLVPEGHLVTSVVARDPDSKQNGIVSYRIVEDGLGFAIHQNNGSIVVKKVLDQIDYEVFQLQIEATDQGEPRRSTRQVLNIIV
ncbi:hypothetical protein CAPTEDRAFT_86451, partial [Capitella teleta]